MKPDSASYNNREKEGIIRLGINAPTPTFKTFEMK